MNLKSFRKPATQTQEGALLSDSVNDYTAQLSTNPMLAGTLVKNVRVGTVETSINHSLGKPFIGWLVVRNRTNVTIYEGTQKNPAGSLVLLASGAGLIDVWVF